MTAVALEVTTLSMWKARMLAEGYSPRTVTTRLDQVGAIARHGQVDPARLTTEHLLGYLGRREYAPWSRLKYLAHVQAWAAFAGIADPTEGVRRPKAPRGLPKPVSEPTLARLLLAARPGRERGFIVLGAYAGLRSFETAKVACEDLESIADGWSLRVLGKGGQLGLVPAPPIVVDEVHAAAELVGGRGRLWPSASDRSVQGAVRRVADRAGVRATSHQLRHRYGTAVYAESKDLLLTQQVMRHASPATTAGYALVVADRATAVVSRLPGAARANGRR